MKIAKIAFNKLKWLLLAFLLFYLDNALQVWFILGKNLSKTGTSLTATLVFLLATLLLFLLFKFLREPLSIKSLASTKFAWYLLALPAVFITNVIGSLVQQLLTHSSASANQNALMNLGMPFYLAIAFLVIFAPVTEELIFRKCLLEKVFGFEGYWKWIGWLVTAFLFAAIHLVRDPANIGGWITYGGMGLVFGFVAMQSKRVEYSIAIHMFMNAYATFIMILMTLGQ